MTATKEDLTKEIINRILVPLGLRNDIPSSVMESLNDVTRKLVCEKCVDHMKKLVIGLADYLSDDERPFIIHNLLDRFFENHLHIRFKKLCVYFKSINSKICFDKSFSFISDRIFN